MAPITNERIHRPTQPRPPVLRKDLFHKLIKESIAYGKNRLEVHLDDFLGILWKEKRIDQPERKSPLERRKGIGHNNEECPVHSVEGILRGLGMELNWFLSMIHINTPGIPIQRL